MGQASGGPLAGELPVPSQHSASLPRRQDAEARELGKKPYQKPTVSVAALKIEERLMSCGKTHPQYPSCRPHRNTRAS